MKVERSFCGPQGGIQALGDPSFNSGPTTAKIDTDGNPEMQGHDPNWNPTASGTVNGQPVNSAKYAYVVMSKRQMLLDCVSLADWATVTKTAPERRPLRESKTGILKAVLARSANLPRQMSGFSAHGFTINS
jgi:hypothetical protein